MRMKISHSSDIKLVRRKMKKRIAIKDNIDAWILLLPAIIILYLFVWRSTFIGTLWSFFDMNGYTVGNFCGFDNYIKVLKHTQFIPTLFNTVKYVFWSLIIGFLPPLIIAIMLNEIIHFKNQFRMLIYIPAVIPGIAAMLIWYYIYYPDQSGLLNIFLNRLGLQPYAWLNNPNFTIVGLIIYSTWKNFGGSMCCIMQHFRVLL